MPHVDDSDQGLPKTPPREQAPIPKPSEAQAATKAQIGLLPTLSVANYEPDPQKVDKALGVSQHTEVPANGGPSQPDMRFQQPKY